MPVCGLATHIEDGFAVCEHFVQFKWMLNKVNIVSRLVAFLNVNHRRFMVTS